MKKIKHANYISSWVVLNGLFKILEGWCFIHPFFPMTFGHQRMSARLGCSNLQKQRLGRRFQRCVMCALKLFAMKFGWSGCFWGIFLVFGKSKVTHSIFFVSKSLNFAPFIKSLLRFLSSLPWLCNNNSTSTTLDRWLLCCTLALH